MSTLEAATGQASIYDLASQFQRDLAAGDAKSVRAMHGAWGAIGKQTERDAASLSQQIEEYKAQHPGEPIPNGWLYKQERYRVLRQNIDRGLASTTPDQVDALERAQTRAALLAGDDAASLVEAVTGRPSLAATFTGVRTDVIENFVGFLANGSPLHTLVAALGQEYVGVVNVTLVNAIANGWGPDRIARQLRRVTGMAAARAETIARTEAMRIYRHVSHMTYLENADVLSGWTWHSRRDMRCCSTCWAMGGTVHQLEEQLDGHPNCRCIMVPTTKLWDPKLGVAETRTKGANDAEAAFARLSPAQRRQILGPNKAKLYERGEINLSDTVKREDNGPWGTMRRQASAKDAKAHAQARKLGKGKAGEDEAWRLGGQHGHKPGSVVKPTAHSPGTPKLPDRPIPRPTQTTGRFIDDDVKTALEPTRKYDKDARKRVQAAMSKTPEQKEAFKALSRFQWQGDIKAMRKDIASRLAGDALDPKKEARADALIGFLRDAPPDWAPEKVWRGMAVPGNIDSVLAKYVPGSDLDLNITSFSSDRKIANHFRFQALSKSKIKDPSKRTGVMVEVVGPNKRMAPISNIAQGDGIHEEQEWVGAGKFRVLESKKVNGGILLRIQQIGTL